VKYQPPTGSPEANAPYVGRNKAAGIQGSRVPPKAVEHHLRELVHLIEYAEAKRPGTVGAPDEALLDQVRKSIEALIAAGASKQPVYPEIQTGNNRFIIGTTIGLVTIDAAQLWRYRGLVELSTAAFSADPLAPLKRAFVTNASRTYHLRWHAAGTGLAAPASTYPNGRFVLLDLGDPAYNPSTVPANETNTSFDTTFDDMLIAKVVTNVSNQPTVTALANKDSLRLYVEKLTYETSLQLVERGPNTAPTYALDWARTPQMNWNYIKTGPATSFLLDVMVNQFFDVSRYSARPQIVGIYIDNSFNFTTGEKGTIDGAYSGIISA